MTRPLEALLPPNRAAVMAILNVTPDSFSDGGALIGDGAVDGDRLRRRAAELVNAGADLFDVGGESTRPGATAVSTDEELARVVPAIRLLKAEFDLPVSVDTSNPIVMAEAAAVGADLINDVRALTEPGALKAAADTGLAVCVMHMQGSPATMQKDPAYGDVVAEVCAYLEDRVRACEEMGIARQSILIDPGFGFGKTLAHNLALFRALPTFVETKLPVLVGVSRKGMVGQITGQPVHRRAAGSVALALLAAQRGAKILRVHDVADTVDALKIRQAIEDKEAL